MNRTIIFIVFNIAIVYSTFTMFSCVKPVSVVDPYQTNPNLSTSNTSIINNNNDEEYMNIDDVLSTLSLLKKKCKSLRTILYETEQKRSEEKIQYEKDLENIKNQYDSNILEITANHMFELQQLHDYKVYELDDLRKKIQYTTTELSMQGSLIIALTHKVTNYEQENEILMKQQHDMQEIIDQYEYNRTMNETETENIHRTEDINSESNCNRIDIALQDDMEKLIEEQSDQIHLLLKEKDELLLKLKDSTYLTPESDKDVNKIKEQLVLSRAQVTDLQSTINELIKNKDIIDETTRLVLNDNEQLHSYLQTLVQSSNKCDVNTCSVSTVTSSIPPLSSHPMLSQRTTKTLT